ncbi:transglutaminase-like cysteine peptidase [Marinobacterium sp. MBR-109]|jgi:predicted transglutaminase-like cysteine proteinase|uniref:transglutaminase-like cysteine peptidase n=1 Tax=Marinobacterium sp. MBR-109 TaxID=3156462 RepID=UPI00339B5065
MLKQLQAVLDDAHNQHEYHYDHDRYGISEYWTVDLVGDCEDFALWSRDQLEQQGIHPDLVFCRVETGGGHLVLHVDGWILDNRHKWVMRQDDLPYEWVKMGVPNGDAYDWYEVNKMATEGAKG